MAENTHTTAYMCNVTITFLDGIVSKELQEQKWLHRVFLQIDAMRMLLPG